MSSWRGDQKNPAPNSLQEPIDRSEKIIKDDRSLQIRRDKDIQKDFTISLEDIDTTILQHLENMQIQVDDNGQKIKVPIIFGPPEKWTSAQRDGYFRDKQGKLILPLIVVKRTNSESDTTLQLFNRHLESSVMKRYSSKNQYTQFNTLCGKNVPVNEVYNIVIPSHMLLTYHFIIWTELVEQQNQIVQTIQFNTKDYWGTTEGFKFRTRTESFSHTIEMEADEDRVVKTEFDLATHGYILPYSTNYLERHKLTTRKLLTPKKVVIGMETVSGNCDFNGLNKNKEKWRNWKYPNLQKDVVIPSPPVSLDTSIVDIAATSIQVDNSPLFLRIVPVPSTEFSSGQDGDMTYDSQYFYLYNKGWRRVAISHFVQACSDNIPPGPTTTGVAYNSQYFYVYSGGGWKKVAMSTISLSTPGYEGDVMYDTEYIYIYTSDSWRRVALTSF
jgi:hypothetical protein